MEEKQPNTPIRALALMSGGLDSQLAVCVVREQKIEVEGLCFESPFFSSAPARAAAKQLGIPLTIIDFTEDIVALIKSPPHGFGSCMNPCIDCHARMFHRAGKRMEERGFHFLITGEVLNERPKSQNPKSLKIVARDSGYPDLVLRPLSAQLLPETTPEKKGWVDRSRLLSLQGRARTPQFELAKRYKLLDYPTPAGGCLLTDPNFCVRLRDLKQHEGIDSAADLRRLRLGRHFRLGERMKLVVGRNAKENGLLERHAAASEWVLKTETVPGPVIIAPPTATRDDLRRAAAICARYSDCPADGSVVVTVRGPGVLEHVETMPIPEKELARWKI